jgi:hypothetical protein
LNAWVEPERALVGVDTEVAMLGVKALGSVNKLFILIHLNAVLAFRGNLRFAAVLLAHCQNPCSNFDELLDRMPAFVRIAFRQMTRSLSLIERIRVGKSLDEQSVVLVGCSARAGRMIGRAYEQESRETGFVVEDLNPYYNAPWDVSLPQFPDLKTPQGMGVLARAQTRLLREKAPDVATGGRFIVAEIRRDSMTIATVCELG